MPKEAGAEGVHRCFAQDCLTEERLSQSKKTYNVYSE